MSSLSVTQGPLSVDYLSLLPEYQALLLPYLPSYDTNSCSLTLTYAQSLDGQIALAPNTQTALSGKGTKAMTHFLRSRHDAILVGVGTAEADDPSLNCRFAEPAVGNRDSDKDGDGGKRKESLTSLGIERQPRPIILDPSGRWSCRAESKVLTLARNGVGKGPFWLVSSENSSKIDIEKVKILKAVGGELLCRDEFWEDAGVQWGVVLRRLWVKGIRSVMVEGGGKVIEDLFREENQELVDSIIITIAPVWLGRGGVLVSPEREGEGEVARLENVQWLQIEDDAVMAGRLKLKKMEADMLM